MKWIIGYALLASLCIVGLVLFARDWKRKLDRAGCIINIPVALLSKFFHPDDYSFLAAHRGVAQIPLLTPLSGYRRVMRAVMFLMEDPSPESQRLLEQLATGDTAAPLIHAAKKAVAIHSAHASKR